MRRNPLYKKYCTVINRYNEYFKKIGVYDFMQSKAYMDEMTDYCSAHDDKQSLAHTPFRTRLEKDHGIEAGQLFFRYGFLSSGYELKFGRIYKDYSIGIDPCGMIDRMIRGDDISFFTEDLFDIAALIKLNGKLAEDDAHGSATGADKNRGQWLITIDDEAPSNFHFDLKRAGDIRLDPEGILSNPAKVGCEVYALNLINKTVANLFEKQRPTEESLQAVYNLNMAGTRFKSVDSMRLAMLWMWDMAHKGNGSEPAGFDEVYELLKEKVEEIGILGKSKLVEKGTQGKKGGPWEQFMTRRQRILGYYNVTATCINNITVTCLNY